MSVYVCFVFWIVFEAFILTRSMCYFPKIPVYVVPRTVHLTARDVQHTADAVRYTTRAVQNTSLVGHDTTDVVWYTRVVQMLCKCGPSVVELSRSFIVEVSRSERADGPHMCKGCGLGDGKSSPAKTFDSVTLVSASDGLPPLVAFAATSG
jgi:hypothetical protein